MTACRISIGSQKYEISNKFPRELRSTAIASIRPFVLDITGTYIYYYTLIRSNL